MTPLGPLLSSKGRDIAGVKHNFEPSASRTSYPILYGHQHAMNRMDLAGDFIEYGKPKTGNRAETMHKSFASTLLIAERPHLNSECVLAVEVSKPVLTTAFWEIKLKNDQGRELLLLWLNSTYGFLMALGAGANSQGPIFKIKQDHVDDILVPRPTEQLLAEAKLLYQSIRRRELLPYLDEFKLAGLGVGVRAEIDRFFERHLHLPVTAKDLYSLFAIEPAISQARQGTTIGQATLSRYDGEATGEQTKLGA